VSIGQTLAAAREEAGLSIDRVSEATRIRQTIVEAIERDDFSLCGGDFYTRGHIRSIAGVVGADPAPLLAEFDAGHEDPASRSLEALQSETYTSRRPAAGPNWSAAMAVVLVLVLAYGVFQVATDDGGGGEPPAAGPAATATATPSPSPSPTRSTAPEATEPSGPVAVAPVEGVRVRLKVVGGDSWVSVRDPAGRQLFQGILSDGTVRKFRDDALLRLVLGNAGAVRLTVNGEPVGPAGGPGEVVRLEFAEDDPTAG
jgi:cytoskeleton protein RodZ